MNSIQSDSQDCVYNETTFTIDETNNPEKPNKVRGLKKYKNELKQLLPYRKIQIDTELTTNDTNNNKNGTARSGSSILTNERCMDSVDELNCFQYTFFTWMSPIIAKIFNQKFSIADIVRCSPYDSCRLNSSRLKEIWVKECNRSGLHNASLAWTIFRFIRTRFLVSCLFYIFCLTTGYLSSTFFVKQLLDEIEISLHRDTSNSTTSNSEMLNDEGIVDSNIISDKNIWSRHLHYAAIRWTIALCICELLRAISFSLMFAVTIRTAIRAANALNGIIFDKILTKQSGTSNVVKLNEGGATVNGKSNSQSSKSDSSSASSSLSNLLSNDIWKVYQMIYMLPLVIGSPIIIVVTIVYTYQLIGQSAIYGIVFFMFIFVLQLLITRRQSSLRQLTMAITDQRITLVTQLMKFIRAIKFNGWEKTFQDEIIYCRDSEASFIRRYQYLQCLSTSLALMTPMLITIVNILVHTVLLKNDLPVSTAFSLVMLNYIAAHGIRSLPNYLREIVNGRIAMKRIERFLRTDDQIPYITTDIVDPNNSIEIVDASFCWTSNHHAASTTLPSTLPPSNRPASFILSNINLEIRNGSHLCVYGPVGSGKTALLASILGQTLRFSGDVRLASMKISYVSQVPWLQNTTIRENILFGAPFERKRYYETLLKCCLQEDIGEMREGEETVIGENGVQLSGGQKQRIALARAVYANSDLYLFDDLFSSLDSRVVKLVFKNVIEDMLRNKTVLFVSRHLYLLNEKSRIIIMKNGQIELIDQHSRLLENSPEYRQLVDESRNIEQNSTFESGFEVINREEDEEVDVEEELEDDSNDIPGFEDNQKSSRKKKNIVKLNSNSYDSLLSLLQKCDNSTNKNNGGSTTLSSNKSNSKSTKERSSISSQTYQDYIRACGGWLVFTSMLLIFIVQTVTSIFSNWWLSYWLNQGSGPKMNVSDNSILANPDIVFYQSVYLTTFFVVIFTALLMGFVFARLIVTAANRLHARSLQKICTSPISFFDSIQLGKIVNLFGHNVDEIDNQLPVSLDGFLQRSLLVIGAVSIIVGTLYWFSIPFVLFVVAFGLIFRYYRVAMYWLKQSEMKLRSPIYGYVQSTVDGLATVKAFGVERQFTEQFYSRADRQIAGHYLLQSAVRWLSIRVDFICVSISVVVCILVLVNLDSVGSAYAGLVITQSMQLSGLLQFVIRLALELETKLISVERIQVYTRLLKAEKSVISYDSNLYSDVEADGEGIDDHDEKTTNTNINYDPTIWPEHGRVSFREVSFRYRPNLPRALDNVSFDLTAGEKVAIVGRTGAGKSSITYALFRLVTPESGSIHIDGVDTRSIPLKSLRSKLTIIPQDPVLFHGTIRKNLDPLQRSSDLELWTVLKQVRLSEKVELFNHQLDAKVSMSEDDQFSTGEKQLLCLARALLRKSRIVVLDEATSSVDDQTEKVIWNIIETLFKDCTVILIAHRLQTVLKCDQVIVIKSAKIIEYGNPLQLKDEPNSHFANMLSK